MSFLTVGCAARYHGPVRAALSNPSIEAMAPVWIAKIDGQAVPRLSLSGEKRLVISPGQHLLELQYSGHEDRDYENTYGQHRTLTISQRSRKNILLPINAVPQKYYYVHAGVVGNTWRPYINENSPKSFLEQPTP